MSNNCHWALIIDKTLFELFEPASHDFHLYKRLEHDIRKLFLPNRSPLKSRNSQFPWIKSNYLSILLVRFWLAPRKILNPTFILNNIFHFRFCKTVSIGTTTPPKCIPAFDAKSSFEVQAVARRKHDQLNQNKTNLADLGLSTIILIAFCGFFMRLVKYQDFIIQILFLVALTSRSSSRNIYRKGMSVYISVSSIFPLKQLKYHLAL